jgi:hypothetical protein
MIGPKKGGRSLLILLLSEEARPGLLRNAVDTQEGNGRRNLGRCVDRAEVPDATKGIPLYEEGVANG